MKFYIRIGGVTLRVYKKFWELVRTLVDPIYIKGVEENTKEKTIEIITDEENKLPFSVTREATNREVTIHTKNKRTESHRASSDPSFYGFIQECEKTGLNSVLEKARILGLIDDVFDFVNIAESLRLEDIFRKAVKNKIER